MTVQKNYIYKVYRSGVYIGNIPNVTSDFSYTWSINTSGSTLQVVSATSADISDQAPPYLTTEDGKIITTEDGTYITTDTVPENVGTGDTVGNIIFRNGNQIRVYEVGENNLNGKIVFRGTIERLEINFGGDSDQLSSDESITVLIYSDGQDLNNGVVPGSDSLFIDQSQLNQSDFIYIDDIPPAQSFIVGVAITNVAAVNIMLSVESSPYPVTAYLVRGNPTIAYKTAALATTTLTITSTSASVYQFVFPLPAESIPGDTYTVILDGTSSGTLGDGSHILAYFSDTHDYADGGLFLLTYDSSGNPSRWIGPANQSMYFETYYSDYTVDNTFTDEDPSNILKSVIDSYVSAGGLINYGSGTVDLTGATATYEFSLSSTYNAVQKCLDLSPFGFYWYVDLGTDILYFKQVSDDADIKLTKGIHIDALNLVLTTENIANLEYFSGGNAGSGPNLFKQYSDQTSIQTFGPRLSLQSDNRVTSGGTADILGAAFIDENKDEQYQTQVTVADSSLDTTLLKPGQNVGFNGFGTFIDSVVLQIVEIYYEPEQVTLTLGRIPPRVNSTLQQATNDINALQTIDNPSAPS